MSNHEATVFIVLVFGIVVLAIVGGVSYRRAGTPQTWKVGGSKIHVESPSR